MATNRQPGTPEIAHEFWTPQGIRFFECICTPCIPHTVYLTHTIGPKFVGLPPLPSRCYSFSPAIGTLLAHEAGVDQEDIVEASQAAPEEDEDLKVFGRSFFYVFLRSCCFGGLWGHFL